MIHWLTTALMMLTASLPVLSSGQSRCEHLSSLAWKYKDISADSSLYYAQLALAAARQEGNMRIAAYSLSDIGNIYKRNGNYPDAIKYQRWSLTARQRLGDPKEVASGYNLLGLTHKKAGEYKNAAIAFRSGMEALSQQNEPLLMAKMQDGLAMAHLGLLQYDSAATNMMEAMITFEELGAKQDLANACHNMGRIFQEMHSYQEAERYYTKALQLNKALGNAKGSCETSFSLGGLLVNAGRLTEAERLLTEAKKMSLEGGFLANLAPIDNNLSVLYQLQGNPSGAVRLQEEVFSTARAQKSHLDALLAALSLSELMQQQGNYKEGVSWADSAQSLLSDTLDLINTARLSAIRSSLLAGLGDYEGAFRESQSYRQATDSITKLLDKTQDLQAEMLRAENQHRVAEQQATHRAMWLRQQWIFGTASFFVVALLIIVMLVLRSRSFRQRLRHHQEQEAKDAQIREIISQVEEQVQATRINTQESERKRIAKHIHDSIGSGLALVQTLLDGIRPSVEKLPGNIPGRFESAMEQLDSSCEEVRSVAHSMEVGLLGQHRLDHEVQEFCKAIESSGNLEIHFVEVGFPATMASEAQLELTKVVKELLTNVIKHSHASKAVVQLIGTAENLTIMVEDNGKGFTLDGKAVSGMGLRNAEETVCNLGGRLLVDSNPSTGTVVTLVTPIKTA